MKTETKVIIPSTMATERPISERIAELKAKIALLDGDRKAYYESSQHTLLQNRETIQTLRRETKQLRMKKSDALSHDQHVISTALGDQRRQMKAAMKNKTGTEAIVIMDNGVCHARKGLDNIRHLNAGKEKKLEQMQTKYDQMVKDGSETVATDLWGESADEQTIRSLWNSFDKTNMKITHATCIQKKYQDIKSRLLMHAEKYPSILDAEVAEIRSTNKELKELREMHKDAQISKEAAQDNLAESEKIVYTEKKKREIELQIMKKKAEEKKMLHEKIERRINQRGSIQQDDVSPQEKQQGEEQQQKIASYEEAFRHIKAATGVCDAMEVVHRFQQQGETFQCLDSMATSNQKNINKLTEMRDKLRHEFEDLKYSGDGKLSSGQIQLEEFVEQVHTEEQRQEEAEDTLFQNSTLLVSVKAGVEHLSDKLGHLKANKGHVPTAQIPPTSDEYVLDQLSLCEEKLLNVLENVDGKDVDAITKEMEEEDFHAAVEARLPQYNTRIKLPQNERDVVFDDDEDSGDEDTDVPGRATIKKQSQLIVDSRTKRRTAKKKKMKK